MREVANRNKGAPQTRICSGAIFSEGVSTRGEGVPTDPEVKCGARTYANRVVTRVTGNSPQRHTWRAGSDSTEVGRDHSLPSDVVDEKGVERQRNSVQ